MLSEKQLTEIGQRSRDALERADYDGTACYASRLEYIVKTDIPLLTEEIKRLRKITKKLISEVPYEEVCNEECHSTDCEKCILGEENVSEKE